jgi:hypothetical protein
LIDEADQILFDAARRTMSFINNGTFPVIDAVEDVGEDSRCEGKIDIHQREFANEADQRIALASPVGSPSRICLSASGLSPASWPEVCGRGKESSCKEFVDASAW